MSHRRLPSRSILWALLAAALPQLAWCADEGPSSLNTEPAGRKATDTVRFRRVYAPADRLPEWLHDNAKYVPIKPAEFERLMRLARTATPGAGALAAARPVTALYRARLVGDRLTGGEASLQVIHSAKAPVLLPLKPCSLAIGKASWAATAGQGGEESPGATLGLGADGKLAVLVERSGRLDFDWSLTGQRDAAGGLSFQLELPRCPTNRLVLEVPENMDLFADHGVLSEAIPAVDGFPQQRGFRRWNVELGGDHRVGLRLVAVGTVPQRPPSVRESVEYHFSLRGVTVKAELELKVQNVLLRQVTVTLDPELQLVDAPVPWSVISANDGPVTRAVLTLPEPIQDTTRVLKLEALAPLVTDRRWRLPRIRVEKVFWQEGHATLIVPSPLSVQQFEPVDCRQTGTGPLSASRGGESFQFEYFRPEGSVEIVLSRDDTQLELASGTAVVLGSREMTAQVRTVFSTSGAPWFSLEADVAQHWLIDSVATFPADALDDWDPDRRSGGKRKLSVRLAKALSSDQPIRLEVTARRPLSPLGRELRISELVPLRFSAPEQSKQLVAVDPVSPYQLKLSGSEQLKQVDPRSLGTGEMQLFAEPPRNLLFENDAGAAELRIALERGNPSYSARLQVEANLAGETLQESYFLRCVPESARVDHVLVHFSHRREMPLRWTLGEEDDQQLSARLLPMDQQAAAGLAPEGETWELTLRRPRSQLFEIRGIRQLELSEEQPISLAWLPEATSQQATLVIRSTGSEGVRVTNRRLKAIPAAVPRSPGRYQTARATYRYDPPNDCLAAPEAAVTVSPGEGPATPLAWVWHGEIESRYETNGTGRHVAIYRLQSSGSGQIRFELPPSVAKQDLHGVWVDGKRVREHRLADDRLAIDLPPGEKFPIVWIHFTTRGTPLGVAGSLQPPQPETDLPVLAQHWTVWLPPGYEASDLDLRWQPSRAPQPGWSRRLFGPLGRAPGWKAFDPLSAEHWSAGVSDRSARRLAKGNAERLLQALGKLAAENAVGLENGRLDWAELLSKASVEASQLIFLVDRHALARIGLSPKTAVQPEPGSSPSAVGVKLLQRANLALLVHPDAVLLTSQTDAALLHAHLAPLAHGALWWVLPGALAEQLRQAATSPPRAALVPVENWCRQPAEPKVPWTDAGLRGDQPHDARGWTAYRMETPGRQTSGQPFLRLKFVRCQTMRLLGSVAFLLTVAFGWWKLGERPVLLTSLVGIFGFAALLLPEAYVPLASGPVLGVLFCLACGLARRRKAVRPLAGNSGEKEELPRSVAGAIQLGVVLLVSTAPSARSAVARQPGQPLGANVHRVIIPVDKQQQPTGGRYHVPEELYDQLHRRAAAVAAKPQGWLITAATYRGVLVRRTGSEGLAVEQFEAIFDLHVFGPVSRVRIPFRRKEIHLLPDGVLLDGNVIQPEWEPDGEVLTFEVPEAGQYRLELGLRPTMDDSRPARLDLKIPRLATSRLELSLPPGAPSIEVPSALGSVRRVEEPPRLIAQLGPTDRLALRWADGAGPQRPDPAVDVEEMLWLKVLPGSVLLDARFKFKIIEGQLRQFRLATDPQLRLDRVELDGQPVEKPRVAAGQPQMITLPCPRPVSKAVVVDATFLLRETSGVGNLRLPALRALDARSTRRWLAVSVDPARKYQQQQPKRFEPVAVPDFLSAWGPADAQPLFAHRLQPGQHDFSISTWPIEPETTVEQTLVLSFDADRTEVYFDAELLTTAGYNFQYRLTVPPALQVQDVSLREEGAQRAARWAKSREGTVSVFLNGPVDGRQKFSLRGRLPASSKRRNMPLPRLQIEGSTLRSSEIQLFRRPSVLVKLGRTSGLLVVEDPLEDPNQAEWGRLMGRFRADAERPIRGVLTVEPNRPKVEAEQLTRLRCDGPSWTAEVDYRIRVTAGAVDQFRIDAPGPLEIAQAKVSPPATLKVDRGSRELIVYPPEAIEGVYQFSISAPLALEPGDRPRVPQIELKRIDRLRRLLCLPKQVEGRAIDWDKRNLRETELPDAFAATGRPESFVTYEVRGEPYEAVLKSPDRSRGTAQVHLADIRLGWKADGTCHGVASFDLEPGTSSRCPLRLPAGYRLVQVLVAGVPAEPVPIRANEWQVPLGPQGLPQRIEVVFTGVLPEPPGSASQRFDAPTLGELRADQTLWTVVGPPVFKPGKWEDSGSTSRAEQELIRLKSAADRIESASTRSAEDPEETFRWYWCWARRLAAARAALHRGPSPTALTREQRDLLRTIDRQQAEIAARLGMTNVRAQFSSGPSVADDPVELWQSSLDHRQPAFLGQTATRCAFSKGLDSIALTYRRAAAGRLQGGLTSASCLAVLVVLVVVGLRRGILPELFKRWPAAIGVAVGLAWWLWLSPSILGWGIVLVSLTTSLLSGWKRTTPAQGSSVISIRTVPR